MHMLYIRLCCSFQALEGVGWWKHYGGSAKSRIVTKGWTMLSRRKKFFWCEDGRQCDVNFILIY